MSALITVSNILALESFMLVFSCVCLDVESDLLGESLQKE